jgi:hypothetical protein
MKILYTRMERMEYYYAPVMKGRGLPMAVTRDRKFLGISKVAPASAGRAYLSFGEAVVVH